MPAKAKTASNAKNKKQDFVLVFQSLRKILSPYDKRLLVVKDGPSGYFSESTSIRYQGKPVMFASITNKSYVSFHLFPVYMFPDLLKGMSPELKKRMQGKACWNFKKVEGPLFAELATVVKASFERFAKVGERDLSREDAQALWGAAQKKS